MSQQDLPKPDFPKEEEQIACEPHPKGVVLSVRAHAGAKRQGVTGMREGALCISVTVAPEQGKANKAIGKVLAKRLGISVSRIELFSGGTGLWRYRKTETVLCGGVVGRRGAGHFQNPLA